MSRDLPTPASPLRELSRRYAGYRARLVAAVLLSTVNKVADVVPELLIGAAVDVVVPVARGADGRRRVPGIWTWAADDRSAPGSLAPHGLPRLVMVVDQDGRAGVAARHLARAPAA